MRLTSTLSLAPFNGTQTGICLKLSGTTTPRSLCANVKYPTSAFLKMMKAALIRKEESSTVIGMVLVRSAWIKTMKITRVSNLKEIPAL